MAAGGGRVIVGRGVLTPLFYEDPPNIAYPLFFKFAQLPLPCCPQAPPPLLILLSCFFGWMGGRATFDVLFYLMTSWMYTCRALGPWCMFYATRRQVYWVLTCDIVFCLYSDLITHTHTHSHSHIHTHTQDTRHTQGPVDWHTLYKYIFTHQLLCAHGSYLYYIEWIIPTIRVILLPSPPPRLTPGTSKFLAKI